MMDVIPPVISLKKLLGVRRFYRDDTELPRGRPGELIQIEPPQYICMQVSDDNGITTVPCKRMSDDIEY